MVFYISLDLNVSHFQWKKINVKKENMNIFRFFLKTKYNVQIKLLVCPSGKNSCEVKNELGHPDRREVSNFAFA